MNEPRNAPASTAFVLHCFVCVLPDRPPPPLPGTSQEGCSNRGKGRREQWGGGGCSLELPTSVGEEGEEEDDK